MTLEEIEAMPGERIGTKELSELYELSRGDILKKAYTEDPLQRWPFSFTFNGNRLMVPKTAFLNWARGTTWNGAEISFLLVQILDALNALREPQSAQIGEKNT